MHLAGERGPDGEGDEGSGGVVVSKEFHEVCANARPRPTGHALYYQQLSAPTHTYTHVRDVVALYHHQLPSPPNTPTHTHTHTHSERKVKQCVAG